MEKVDKKVLNIELFTKLWTIVYAIGLIAITICLVNVFNLNRKVELLEAQCFNYEKRLNQFDLIFESVLKNVHQQVFLMIRYRYMDR